jgi:Transglutaminase-like superfamily
MSRRDRGALAVRVWATYARVKIATWRRPLPEAVSRVAPTPRTRARRHSPERLSRAVHACLWPLIGSPRCLFSSLTLFRLLAEQGERPQLVIGIDEGATDHRAHAWVELDGRDVGPPPGRGEHRELGRYP